MTLPPLSTQAWASNRPSSLLATPMRKVAGWPRRASITWATKASVRQVLAQDRRRPARPTARTTSSMEDRSALRNPAGASAILATTRRTVLKGSSHTPTLVAASNSAALIRSRRSAAGRRTNLRRRLAPDLNESLVSQAILHLGAEVEDGCLPAEVVRDLLLGRHDGRMLSNRHLHGLKLYHTAVAPHLRDESVRPALEGFAPIGSRSALRTGRRLIRAP